MNFTALALGMVLSGVAGHQALARDMFNADAYSTYKPDAKNGEYMANASGCAACHAPGDDLKLMSGGLKMDTFIGTFYVPNITSHGNGIGGWSNADFLNAVINGVGKDGRNLYPVMPYTSYAGLKPEDVLDMKAYLETLPQSDNKVPSHELSFPYNLSATISFWKRGNFTTAAWQPDDGSQMSRGRYLVENAGACGECHTPRTLDFGIDASRKFEGEKGLTGAVAPDITQGRIASVPQETFIKSVLAEGNKLSGTPIADPIMKKYVEGLAKLNEEDRLAIYAYLTGRPAEAPKIATTSEDACKDTNVIQAALSGGGGDALTAHADDFVGKYCRNCHGPGESAQGSFPTGDLASIATNAAFVVPGDRNRSLLYTSVSSGRMPYGKRPSAAELDKLGQWIDQLGEPVSQLQQAATQIAERKRDVLPWRSFVEAAVRDIGTVNASDRPFIRYFSYRQQYNGKLPCEDESAFDKRLDLYKAGFHKLINSLSLGTSVVVPETIENTKGLLVRLDLRDLKWDSDKWNKLIGEYPFGYEPDSDSSLKSLTDSLDTKLPVMRVDWFMANAPRPEMYHALLDLPENIADLEKRLGIDVDDNIRRRRVVRAAFDEGESGVSDNNRMLERHDAPQGGYYWKSYDMASSRGDADLKRHPHGPESVGELDEGLKPFKHDGGEMIFSLPNGLQGYYLSTNKGDRLDRGPTSIVSFRNRPIGKGVDIINGRSCFDCHSDGIIAKRDRLRDFIESSPTFSIGQRDLLLELYVKQSELEEVYAKDREHFIRALEKAGATERAPDGTLKSRTGPGKEEIITWNADLYEDDLDAEALAAEFDMTPQEFEQSIQRVSDSDTLRLGLDWITQLKGGSKVPRFEVEQQFAKLVKPLMNVAPLEFEKEEEAASSNEDKSGETKSASSGTPEYKDPDYRDDAFKGDDDKGGKLTLAVKVANTDVFVDEQLSFDVTANKECEVQIFYIESDGNVEVIPQEMIGDKNLPAGKARTIPDPASGKLVFDTPGADETLLLFCREGGLGKQRLSAEDAKKLVKKSGETATRGLAIKLFEKAKSDEKKADAKAGGDAKEGGKGTSAIHMVTFNVKARS
ncbi:MAG: c-type cytochrome [Rhizobiaceae bacterium]